MVCCIVLGKFVYALWPLFFILFRYVYNYGLLQIQVGKWCAGLSHPRSPFLVNMTSVHVRCVLRDYSNKCGISDFWWKIHTSRGWCAAAWYIPMWGPCKDVFSLTILQDSLCASKLVRVGGSLYDTVVGRCRCLKNVFTSVLVLSGQTYVPSKISSICGPSMKAPISKYNQGSSSNGKAPVVWWCFLNFSAIRTFSSGFFLWFPVYCRWFVVEWQR